MQKLVQTFIALFISVSVSAQIEAPNLICVTTLFDGNVELEWELPAPNSCGAFLGYRIYATPDPTAPYSLLATVTNPNQTSYTHINANGNVQTWYYYMTTDLQCPTLSIEQSNTLDNLDPVTPPITSVSINGDGTTTLNWEVSSSLETAAYVIYRETNSGFIAVDTVFGRTTTSFVDLSANAGSRETYTIAAMDACGNIGLLYEVPHQTILATASVNRCDKTIELSWDAYENWDNPVAAYQLRASVNGSTPELAATVSGGTAAYPLSGFNDGDSVCLTAQAVELGTGHASMTNVVCVSASFVEPMAYIYLSNVSITDDNALELFWNWDENADIETYTIQVDSGNVVLNATMPLQPLDYHLDTTIQVDTGSVTLQLITTDSCGEQVTSTRAKTIFLEGGIGSDYQNLLHWSPFEMDYAEVYSYQIYRIVEDIPELIESVDGNTLHYADAVNGLNPSESDIRYYVVAQVYINLPDGTAKVVFSQSNTMQIEQPSRIFMPNAFVPNGKNNLFRPRMVFADNSSFEMYIYDRYGRKLYETNDPEIGWDGRAADGKIMRQGVYTYIVRVTQLDGAIVEQRGTVVLIQ
jgi:gliding motility-associated-like protein